VDDQPTIGLILCTSKSKTVVEYALRNLNTPIGVETHRLSKQIEERLPSVEQLEIELENALSEVEAQERGDL
jgi:YhcG PDDEXK nuclease domain